MRRLAHFLLLLLLLTLSACGPSRTAPTPTLASPASAAIAAPATSAPAASAPAASAATVAATAPPLVTPTAMPNPGAPDVADYRISARLDPDQHALTGAETLTYHNRTQAPIPNLLFHLYLNAFKSMDTLFMQESGGQLRGFQFNAQNNGWIVVDSLKIQGGPALDLQLVQDGTLAQAALPAPVQPGGDITLQIAFHEQLPQAFARTGWAQDAEGSLFYLVGQWFPKLAVWTEQGWSAYPFHGNAEFFSDFGSYYVEMTVPSNYVTGATGMPAASRQNSDGTQTVSYQAAGVIDFAWVASPNLKSASQQVGDTEIRYLYLPEHDWSQQRVLESAAASVTRFSAWYGPYPYPRLTVVDVPEKGEGAGGMEYPTFITTETSTRGDQPAPQTGWADGVKITTIHEVAHQWFQSMVATNEGVEPWLDEGFADYSTMLELMDEYGFTTQGMDQGRFSEGYLESRYRSYQRDPAVPMGEKAWDYTFPDYVVAAYAKPDMALLTLDRVLGHPVMLNVMHTYFQRYRFAHPTTADFQKVATEVSGQDLGWFFNGLVSKSETLNYVAKSIDGSTITVDRQGELAIPTDIQVTFSDGSQQNVPWNGQDPQHTFTFNKPVQAFTIDPGHKLIVEINWTDNTLKK